MREIALPGQTPQTGIGDAAVVRARTKQDITVGDEVVRHRLSSRVIHWAVALFFFVALLTGLPIWTPLFGWVATLFVGSTSAAGCTPGPDWHSLPLRWSCSCTGFRRCASNGATASGCRPAA